MELELYEYNMILYEYILLPNHGTWMKYYTLESGSSQATMFSNSSAAMAPVTAPLQAPSRKPEFKSRSKSQWSK